MQPRQLQVEFKGQNWDEVQYFAARMEDRGFTEGEGFFTLYVKSCSFASRPNICFLRCTNLEALKALVDEIDKADMARNVLS